jgi:IS5 family transposase
MFGANIQLERISKLGDPLEKINSIIDWELFRPILEKRTRKEDYSKGGRPPFDAVYMFKIIMLQDWHNSSDENTEYLINDRLSFQRFLGMEMGEKAPDRNTIWIFKEQLGEEGMQELFDMFNKMLEASGIITHKGSIVDASFVDVPKQRNSREENKTIKEGKVPEEWEDPENKNKLEQKDTDARWAKKGDELHYGYKDHAKVDSDSKIIVDFTVTSAEVHDSEEIVDLVDEKDEVMYADSAYVGKELHEEIKEKNPEIELQINEKGYKNRPLTDEQKAINREKSRVRARVEHVFGYITRFMNGIAIRTIGMTRAKREICGMNLAYNIKRVVFLVSSKKATLVS